MMVGNNMFNLLKKLRAKSKPLYRSGTSIEQNTGFISFEALTGTTVNATEKKEDTRLDKKPVEVFNELVAPIPKLDLTNIKERIKMVERRRKVLLTEIGLSSTPDEDEALEYLGSMQKLVKYQDEVSSIFPWAVTTNDLIDDLIKKYKLAKVDFANYYKTVPMEAIDELERFGIAYRNFCSKPPILLLIIDDVPEKSTPQDTRSRERKKDPILLARSPFGRWWFILGAWDKEVAIVDELLYK
jgi:hypothetical protein